MGQSGCFLVVVTADAAASDWLLAAEGLQRRYGERLAVDGVDLRMRRGEVVGLLGVNGAGKTTTLGMLSGTLPPTAGRISVDGVDLLDEPRRAKRSLGYLPEVPPLYPEMRVDEYLAYCGALRAVPRGTRGAAVRRALRRAGLEDVAGRVIGNLSKGYRQRVGIAQAIVHEPALLILDEPTVGLDPVQVQGIRELVRDLKADHGIVFSSHVLPEVQALSDRVVILHRGECVYEGKVATEDRSLVTVAFANDPGAERLQAISGVMSAQPAGDGRWRLRLDESADGGEILATALREGWEVRAFSVGEETLEQLFLDLISGEPA